MTTGRWRTFRLCSALCVATGPGGAAGAQIFHNSVLDAQSKAAMQQYESVKAAHLAYIDSRVVEIDKQQATLVAAANEAIIAERDFAVTTILGEDERAGAPDRLRGEVGERLAEIIPGLVVSCITKPCLPSGTHTPDYARVRKALESFDQTPDPLARTSSEILDDEAKLLKLLAGKKPTNGRTPPATGWSLAWFCREALPVDQDAQERLLSDELVGKMGMTGPDANEFLGEASTKCGQIADGREPFGFEGITDPNMLRALRALGGWGDDAAPEKAPGDPTGLAAGLGPRILRVRAEAGKLKLELKDAEAVARGFRTKRDALLERWTTDRIAADLQRVANCAAALLQEKAKEGAQAPQTGCLKDAGGEPREGFETLFSALGFLTGLADLGPEIERLREEEAFEVVQYLADPAGTHSEAQKACAPAAPGTTPPATRTDAEKEADKRVVRLCLTDAVVRTAGIVERAGEIRDGVPGRIAELAVLLADAEMKAAAIRLRSAALAERAGNLDAQRRALLAEVKALMAIDSDLDRAARDPARLDRGVIRLAESFEHDRLDYQQQVVRYGFIGQRAFAQRERAIISARYAISDALLSTIASSTEGGIKTEQVVGVVSALGLTAVGITEAVK